MKVRLFSLEKCVAKFNFNIISAPQCSAPKLIISSDNYLLKINVTRADHLIHYDLPDNFETFSQRYIVFKNSHSKLPVRFTLILNNQNGNLIEK